jgi:predicted metal-dependent hydrolase
VSGLAPEEREATLRAGIELFDAGRYLAAHELFEELWEATEGEEADFFKGLIQAAIALHHFEAGNLEGAAKLYTGHRSALARYQPAHAGLDVTGFLAAMQRFLRPVVERRPGASVPFVPAERPRLGARRNGDTEPA